MNPPGIPKKGITLPEPELRPESMKRCITDALAICEGTARHWSGNGRNMYPRVFRQFPPVLRDLLAGGLGGVMVETIGFAERSTHLPREWGLWRAGLNICNSFSVADGC